MLTRVSSIFLYLFLTAQAFIVPSTSVGNWITPTFAAGNYTASAGTWTVAGGNVNTNEYTQIGKTVHWVFNITGSSTSNAAAGLIATIPGGFTAAKGTFAVIRVKSAGTNALGLAFITAGTTTINFAIDAAGTGFAISASNADVQGEITFEIQ